MDRPVQALRIENLETQLELRRFVRFSIELELELAATDQEKLILARRWAQATTECQVLTQALEALKGETQR